MLLPLESTQLTLLSQQVEGVEVVEDTTFARDIHWPDVQTLWHVSDKGASNYFSFSQYRMHCLRADVEPGFVYLGSTFSHTKGDVWLNQESGPTTADRKVYLGALLVCFPQASDSIDVVLWLS